MSSSSSAATAAAPRKRRVAVVGSGIAGLTTAWGLCHDPTAEERAEGTAKGRTPARESVEVTMYEAASTQGMDQHSVNLTLPNLEGKDTPMRIDLPLRVFSRDYYPNLMALYSHIGVPMSPESYSASFCLRDSDHGTPQEFCYFRYDNWKCGAYSVAYVWGLRLFSSHFFQIVKDCVRFFYKARAELSHSDIRPQTKDMTFGQWLEDRGFSRPFIRRFLLPAMSAVCTCTYDSTANYPADLMLLYCQDKLHVGVTRAAAGTVDVVNKLSAGVHAVRCNTRIERIYRDPKRGGVVVRDAAGKEEVFDDVVLAVQANQAAQMLDPDEPAFRDQVSALRAFRYEPSIVSLHTDERLMPVDKRNWTSLNMLIDESASMPQATIWMNRAQTNLNTQTNIFQTWSPLLEPEPSKLLAKAEFWRPVITHEARKAQARLGELQGRGGIWFTGAYVKEGIPLLEAGCTSGLEVASALGGSCPWWVSSQSEEQRRKSKGPVWAPWVQAARPTAAPMILLPLFIGAALAGTTHCGSSLGLGKTLALLLTGALFQMTTLYLNDSGDAKTDAANTTYKAIPGMRVSGGSRVIQEGKLSPKALFYGGLVTGGLNVLLSVYLSGVWDLPLLPLLVTVGAVIAWLYSCKPAQVAHRGHGELLQGVGCGVILPVYGYYMQAQTLEGISLAALAVVFALFTAGNIVTALPDVPADRATNKRTYPVRMGEQNARLVVLLVFIACFLAVPVISGLSVAASVAVVGVPVALLALVHRSGLVQTGDVQTSPDGCGAYVLATSVAEAWVLVGWLLALHCGCC